ncbi:MAG: hypothetical protein V7707_08010 [Motiliproteus sp.]
MKNVLAVVAHHWLVITLIILAAITVLSLSPLPALPQVPGSDKTHHFIAYAALMFPTAVRRPQYALLITLGFAGWSGAIELIQPYVNRYGEWLDLAANCGGLICGWLLAMLLSRLFGRQTQL